MVQVCVISSKVFIIKNACTFRKSGWNLLYIILGINLFQMITLEGLVVATNKGRIASLRDRTPLFKFVSDANGESAVIKCVFPSDLIECKLFRNLSGDNPEDFRTEFTFDVAFMKAMCGGFLVRLHFKNPYADAIFKIFNVQRYD